MYLKKTLENADWIYMAQKRQVAGPYENGNKSLDSIKSMEFN
jgi:hypothetical protein